MRLLLRWLGLWALLNGALSEETPRLRAARPHESGTRPSHELAETRRRLAFGPSGADSERRAARDNVRAFGRTHVE